VERVDGDVPTPVLPAIEDIRVVLGALTEAIDTLLGRFAVCQRQFIKLTVAVVIHAVALLLLDSPLATIGPYIVTIGKTDIATDGDAIAAFTAVNRGLRESALVAAIPTVIGILEVIEQRYANAVAIVTTGRAFADPLIACTNAVTLHGTGLLTFVDGPVTIIVDAITKLWQNLALATTLVVAVEVLPAGLTLGDLAFPGLAEIGLYVVLVAGLPATTAMCHLGLGVRTQTLTTIGKTFRADTGTIRTGAKADSSVLADVGILIHQSITFIVQAVADLFHRLGSIALGKAGVATKPLSRALAEGVLHETLGTGLRGNGSLRALTDSSFWLTLLLQAVFGLHFFTEISIRAVVSGGTVMATEATGGPNFDAEVLRGKARLLTNIVAGARAAQLHPFGHADELTIGAGPWHFRALEPFGTLIFAWHCTDLAILRIDTPTHRTIAV